MSLGPVDPSQGGRRSTYGRAYAGQKSAWGRPVRDTRMQRCCSRRTAEWAGRSRH